MCVCVCVCTKVRWICREQREAACRLSISMYDRLVYSHWRYNYDGTGHTLFSREPFCPIVTGSVAFIVCATHTHARVCVYICTRVWLTITKSYLPTTRTIYVQQWNASAGKSNYDRKNKKEKKIKIRKKKTRRNIRHRNVYCTGKRNTRYQRK